MDKKPDAGTDQLQSKLKGLKDSLNTLLEGNENDPVILKGILNSENVVAVIESPSPSPESQPSSSDSSASSQKEEYTPRRSSPESVKEKDKSPPHIHSDKPSAPNQQHGQKSEHQKHVWKRKKRGFFEMLFSGSGPDDVVNGFLNAITGTKDEKST